METPRLWTRRPLLAIIVVVCGGFVLLGLFLAVSRRSVRLPDGSILKVEGVSYGTNEFVVGRRFERAVYKLTSRRLGSNILGIQFCPPVVTPLALPAVGLPNEGLVHFHVTHRKTPPVSASSSGDPRGVIFNGTLIEVFAESGERLQCTGVMSTCCSPSTAYGRLSFPSHDAKFFHLHISRVNESGKTVQLTQIHVLNPAPIGGRN